jgi:hypothetical protein
MAARCFMGGFPLDAVGDEPADAVVFGAPHGTPYPGIDNAPHADSMQALREALASDSDWVDHWSSDSATSGICRRSRRTDRGTGR